MKFDAISTCAEVTPYYGTLDEVYKLMKCCNIKARDTFNNCVIQFGRIIKRRQFDINLSTFFDYLDNYSEKVKLILSIFEINKIEIRTKDEYKMFISKLIMFKDVEIIKINKINMCLSSKDDFTISYENACRRIEYNDEDRSLDEFFNEATETIKQLKLNVRSMNSFIYLEELSKRKVNFCDKVIAVISDNMDSKSFASDIDLIRKNKQNINKIWLISECYQCFKIHQRVFPHKDLFINMPCKSVNVNTYKRDLKVVHLKPSDQIFEYNKYFKKSHWCLSNCHLSGSKQVEFICKNYEGNLKADLCAKSISLNLQNDDIQQVGSMIQIIKCNQSIIEFDNDNIDQFNCQLSNKYQSTLLSNQQRTCIFIDPDCIENIRNLPQNILNLCFENVKKFVGRSIDIANKTNIINNLLKASINPLECDLEGTIGANFKDYIYIDNIQKIKRHHIENMKISILKNNLNEEEIIDILNPILLIKRLNKFHLKINHLKLIKKCFKLSNRFNTKLKVTIETKEKVDIVSTLNLKSQFPNIRFINS